VQLAVTAIHGQPAAVNTTPGKNNRILFAVIAALAVAGIIVSGVSLQRHYAKSASAFCDFGEKFNCDIVNRSEYSTVVGMPVAAIGIAGYGLVLILATVYRSRPETPTRLLAAAIAGLGFALYLTYVEGYVLTTWCILCLTSLTMIAGITLLAAAVKARSHP
jgi:vitamin-K-epoxide reductase (warfarin-sensitive)